LLKKLYTIIPQAFLISSDDLPPENTATSNVIVFNQKEAGDEEKKVWY
jgi:hypothetical protein